MALISRDFQEEAVSSVQKNKRETLLMYVENFKGKNLAHVRTFVKSKDGKLTPTGKGVTIAPELMAEFVTGVQKLADHLKAA